ncbi:ABC transporter permease [Chloroflexota bacterium]
MKFMALAIRNFKETYIDLISLGLVIVFPPILLLILQTIGRVDPFFSVTNLTPGIILFGFAFISLSAGMLLSKDRDTALLSRLLTGPLNARDFILAYSLPYIPVAIIQFILVFAIGALLGFEIIGNIGLVFLILIVMSVGYIGLGMILGTLFTYKTVSIAWIAVNLLTIFGGAWFPLEFVGGGIETAMNALPFAHAVGAARDVMVNGAGFGDILTDLYWVIGYTIVFIALGVFLFRRKMVE